MVGLGNLTTPTAALSLLGLVIIASLQVWRVRGAMLIGILVTAAIGWSIGLAHIAPGGYSLSDLSATAFKLDVPAAFSMKGGVVLSLLEIVLVSCWSTCSTTWVPGCRHETRRVDRTGWQHSAAQPYSHRRLAVHDGGRHGRHESGIELHRKRRRRRGRRAYGIDQRGRRTFVPGYAVSLRRWYRLSRYQRPRRIDSGRRVDDGCAGRGGLGRTARAIPAFLTVVMIPLTYSIANGLAFGTAAIAGPRSMPTISQTFICLRSNGRPRPRSSTASTARPSRSSRLRVRRARRLAPEAV